MNIKVTPKFVYVLTGIFFVGGIVIGMLQPWNRKDLFGEHPVLQQEEKTAFIQPDFPLGAESLKSNDEGVAEVSLEEAPPVISTQYYSDPLPPNRTRAQDILAARALEKITVDESPSKPMRYEPEAFHREISPRLKSPRNISE